MPLAPVSPGVTMKRLRTSVVAALGFCFVIGCSPAKPQPEKDRPTTKPLPEKDRPPNPFGVKLDVVPDDAEVKEFAKKVRLRGGAEDANAAPWVERPVPGKADSLDGEWSGRWKYHLADRWVPQTKPTRIETDGQRVYVLFTYHEGEYLIVALREGKDRLVGRFVSVIEPKDTGPYVGLVVDGERIDGEWKGPSGEGRWDFRRKLTK